MSDKKEDRKESIFCLVHGLETKESSEDKVIKGGYISTTHLDQGFYDGFREVWIKDTVAKETLDAWRDDLNDGNPRANKVSVNHNRTPHVAGVAIKGTARVDSLGIDKTGKEQFGLYVETLVDKTRDDFDDIKFRLDNKLLDSFSIEFHTKDPATGEYMEGAVEERMVEGGIIRTLLPATPLDGYTLASQPMNEHAIMIKEITPKTNKEANIMVEQKEEVIINEEVLEPKVEAPAEKVEEVEAQPEEVVEEAKEVPAVVVEKKEEEKESKVIAEMKEIKTVVSEFKEHLKSIKLEEKGKMNTDNQTQESKEMTEYKEAIKSKSLDVLAQFKVAGKLADSLNLHYEGKERRCESKEYKNFSVNGTKLEYKGLGVGTNSTAYTQSVAELSDVYDPVIYNTLNEMTTFWNILAKDDYSSKGNNKVQFTVKSAANATAGFYTGNAVSLGNTGREKNETKFKKAQAGVEVDGDMIAAARGGPIGDVFSQEVADATESLMSIINQALFAEVGLEAAAGVIGIPYITDAAGNTTLYGLTRSSFGYMDGNSGATYINCASADIALKFLRQAKRQALNDAGSQKENLVFVTNHVQGDKFRAIYDSIQRTVPTSSRFGFEGRPEFDGIPIFEDKDCKSGSWFLVDLKDGYRVGMWVPPTLEMLGKDSDSMKGFIKTYFATYSRNPNSNVEIYGCSTS